MTRYLVTGDAGFIGFHLSQHLLRNGDEVFGIDGLTAYYDLQLKEDRLARLRGFESFTHRSVLLEKLTTVRNEILDFAPEVIVHLAAQAGVRYSIENPDAYISSNVEGTLRLLELARDARPQHLLVASTSSVYGGTQSTTFSEKSPTSSPMSLYAATKIATEALSHSYSHLWNLPITAFRFFTVYGPWGRPDMAPYKFVSAIRAGRSIDVYGHGKMSRDFTYIDDLVSVISQLADNPPSANQKVSKVDTVSPVAPFRVVNAGGGKPVPLIEFIEAIEAATGEVADKNFLPMQLGDVVTTNSDSTLLQDLIGFVPQTDIRDGVSKFVDWYDEYYGDQSMGTAE